MGVPDNPYVSVVVATAVNSEGKREIVGMDVGTSEDGAFWLAFLRSLSARGLSGVELVVSDAHQGLRDAIATVFGGASWQRCRTHFMTNLLTRVPRRAQPWVATMVRTIYQQPSPQEVHAQFERVIAQLQDPFPQVASLLDEAGADVLAFSSFPLAHWKKIWSNNPLERLNKGDTAPHRCRGHLPQSASRASPSWGCPGRTARRMGHRPTLHDTRGLQHRRSSTRDGSREGSGIDVFNRMTPSLTPLDGT